MAVYHSAGWSPNFGGVLKSIGEGGTYGALAVRFSDESERDLQNEYFTEYTDLGMRSASMRVPLLFNHGFPLDGSAVAKRFSDGNFGEALLERVPEGLFGSFTLSASDTLQSAAAKMIAGGALRFSVGSTTQFARREGGRIMRFPIVELSLTPRPAEPRLPKIRPLH